MGSGAIGVTCFGGAFFFGFAFFFAIRFAFFFAPFLAFRFLAKQSHRPIVEVPVVISSSRNRMAQKQLHVYGFGQFHLFEVEIQENRVFVDVLACEYGSGSSLFLGADFLDPHWVGGSFLWRR